MLIVKHKHKCVLYDFQNQSSDKGVPPRVLLWALSGPQPPLKPPSQTSL